VGKEAMKRLLSLLPYPDCLGLTQPPIQWVPEAFSPTGVKQLGHEAEHSPLSSVKVKNELIPPIPRSVFMGWCLVKHKHGMLQGQIYFYLYCQILVEDNICDG